MSAFNLLRTTFPHLNDVWFNHLLLFLLPNAWLMDTWSKILVDELEMVLNHRRFVRRVFPGLSGSTVYSKHRICSNPNGTMTICLWVHDNFHGLGAHMSKYTLYPNTRLITRMYHQDHVMPVYSRQPELQTCMQCGRRFNPIHLFQVVETNQVFTVCIPCEGEEQIWRGVLCMDEKQDQIYSEITTIDV